MRLDKIYTKVGDKGLTHLAGGQKVSKASLRIESYGTVDELNAHLGFWRDLMADHGELLQGLRTQILVIQHELFDLGAELATPLAQLDLQRQQVVGLAAIARLEDEMDAYLATLEPLKNFILPGGHVLNGQAHIARCVCRRAERQTVRLAGEEALRTEPLVYLNRLSDWLFVAGRMATKSLGCQEVLWQQKK